MSSHWKKILFGIFAIFIFFISPYFYCLLPNTYSLAHADSTSDLQSSIDAKNAQIEQLQKEINQYNTQVNAMGVQANTLQNTLKTLDLTAKELTTNITLTESKIGRVNLLISQLSTGISTTTTEISLNKKSLAEMVLQNYQTESQSTLENFFKYTTFSELWNAVEQTHQFQIQIRNKANDLTILKTNLTTTKNTREDEKSQLSQLEQNLSDQQKIVIENTQEKAALLVQTKDQEANYKKILTDKQAQEASYEKDLFDYESQLKLITSANQIPTPRRSTLSWPLDTVYITQLFGVTNASARLYVSGSHNGVDFRATIGTPVKAALAGVVVGTGNTDLEAGCYSFGRWVMIKHAGGLSTIYAHLSLIKAAVGQNVSTGEVIGLSGYSGYVNPPGPRGAHLHLGVYATAGVEIKQFVNSRGCKQVIVPIADIKAYLDPMLYLPSYQ